MSEVRDEGLNLSEAMQGAKEITGTQNGEQTPIVGGNWYSALTPNEPTEAPNTQTTTEQASTIKPVIPVDDPDDVSGYGIIVNNADIKVEQTQVPVTPGTLQPETLEGLDKYMTEMDSAIDVAKYMKENPKNADDDAGEEETPDSFKRKYDEAVVVIDKSGMGTIINFTDIEREKLLRSKKIRLEEVETIKLETIKTKKIKKPNVDEILKQKSNMYSTPIVLPASGYTSHIKGCSAYELLELMDDGSNSNALISIRKKWELIYSKIINSSIDAPSYNEFLHQTAAVDYNVFLYGLICATYPDDDKITLKCEAEGCGKEFDHAYSIKSLIRAERMSPKMSDTVADIINNSFMKDMAIAYHATAPVSQTKTIRLPESGIIVHAYVQSAYDFIEKSVKELSENKDQKYNAPSLMSSVVQRMYIPDDGTDEYFEFDSPMDIAKIIYTLSETDLLILTKQGEALLDDLTFEFGLMNVTCPHCKHFTPVVPIDLDSILFFKYQQARSTRIE